MDFLTRLTDPKATMTAERVWAMVGLVFATPLAMRVANFAWLYFLRPSSMKRYLRPGAWALVTGASDGIGRAFAMDLARRGFNVVLHGRNPVKLDRVASKVRRRYPDRRVMTLIADAADADGMPAAVRSVVSRLREGLDGPLTVLINNCGGTQPQRYAFMNFRDMEPAEIDGMLQLNIRFHLQLTRALLPMLEGRDNSGSGGSGSDKDDDDDDTASKEKDLSDATAMRATATSTPAFAARSRPALILYTGSLAGTIASPFLSVYSPAKDFGAVWIGALAREMRATNPNVECLGILTGKVTDTATFDSRPNFFEPSSMAFARASLDRVGCGLVNVVGYWTHALQAAGALALPESLQTLFITNAIVQQIRIDQAKAAGPTSSK